MATLNAFLSMDVGGASAIEADVRSLCGRGLLHVRDAATVTWLPGQHRPDFRRVDGLEPGAPMGDAFWHLLFGHVFLLPIAAAEAGLPMHAAACSLSQLGILDDFVDSARRRVLPGTSALFLLTDDATVDRLLALLPPLDFTVTSTSLSNRQLQGLWCAFTETRTVTCTTSTQ